MLIFTKENAKLTIENWIVFSRLKGCTCQKQDKRRQQTHFALADLQHSKRDDMDKSNSFVVALLVMSADYWPGSPFTGQRLKQCSAVNFNNRGCNQIKSNQIKSSQIKSTVPKRARTAWHQCISSALQTRLRYWQPEDPLFKAASLCGPKTWSCTRFVSASLDDVDRRCARASRFAAAFRNGKSSEALRRLFTPSSATGCSELSHITRDLRCVTRLSMEISFT